MEIRDKNTSALSMCLLSSVAGAINLIFFLLDGSLPAPSLGPWSAGYVHLTTVGISLPPLWTSLSHCCEHPTTARMLPTSLLNVVSLEGSGLGYNNIPEVCKILK